MIARRHYLASAVVQSLRLVAFDPGRMELALGAGMVNRGAIADLIAAAEMAADQQPITTVFDMESRANDSGAMLEYWDLTDDIVAGYDAVKARGEKYLARFSDEENADFNARLECTEMTNVYRDVVESISGKPFEEEITLVENDTVKLPDDIKQFAENVDGAGNNLSSFAANTFFNGINSAIDWIFVDYPKVEINPQRPRSIQAAKDSGIRPFWSHVLGRNVLEARAEIVAGRETLTYMRILEPGDITHIRVFERAENGVVVWALFRKIIEDNKKQFVLIESGNISIGVIPLVPFATGRRDGRSFRFYPVMRDAADLQIQLYQQESGLKFAKIMTAYPMLAANGIKPQMMPDGKTPKKLAVGPSRVLYSMPDGAGNSGSWRYVSPDAACLTFLKDDVKETMNQLRELGRQPLTAQSGNLTVITTAVAAGKAKTAVAAWGMRLAETLENALVMTCQWLNIPQTTYDPDVKVYDEYDDFNTDQAADLTALASARSAKDLSQKQYMKQLQRRNVLPPDFDNEVNLRELLDETPADTVIMDANGLPIDPNAPPQPGKKPPAPANKPQPPTPAKVK